MKSVLQRSSRRRPLSMGDSRNTRGFTVVELVVVIAIIGILVTIAAVSYRSSTARGDKEAAVAVAQQIRLQLATYFSEKNRYPANMADVTSYLNASSVGEAELAAKFSDAARFGYQGVTAAGGVCSTAGSPKCDRYVITVKKSGWAGDSLDSDVQVTP